MLRLSLLTGIYSALRRHQEVLAAISTSVDRSEAGAAVRSLLGLDQTQAEAVLDLGWNRLTTTSIQEIADEIVWLKASLDTSPFGSTT
jgi:DNA gyrase/topoisomerase IV subunit A